MPFTAHGTVARDRSALGVGIRERFAKYGLKRYATPRAFRRLSGRNVELSRELAVVLRSNRVKESESVPWGSNVGQSNVGFDNLTEHVGSRHCRTLLRTRAQGLVGFQTTQRPT